MKIILSCFLCMVFTASCFSDDYVCLVDKVTGEVSELMTYDSHNESTLNSLAGINKEVKRVDVNQDFIMRVKYKIWDGKNVTEDNTKKNANEYSSFILQKIDAQQNIDAIDKLLLATNDAKEIEELNKHKTELEAKVTALEEASTIKEVTP